MNLKRRVRDAAVILAVTLCVVIFLETGLRLFNRDIAHSIGSWTLAYEFNNSYLVSLRPNIEKKYVRSALNGGDVIDWRTNSDGFRGPELLPSPDYRVIVYGDSNVQARFSRLSNSFPAKLQEYLSSSADRRVEVINAGLIGSGPDQSLIRFMKDAGRYEPDVVVFHVFADNDFGDIVKNRLFDISGAELVPTDLKVSDDPVLVRQKSLLGTLVRTTAVGQVVKDVVKPQPSSADATIEVLMDKVARDYSNFVSGHSTRISHFDDYYDIDLAVDPDSPSSRVKVELMSAVLKQAKSVAEREKVELLVVIQPSIVDITENFRLSHKDLELRFPNYDRRRLSSVVARICTSAEIPFVNLYDTFESHDPPSLFFQGDNNHWNDRGQDLAARTVARYLERHRNSPVSTGAAEVSLR